MRLLISRAHLPTTSWLRHPGYVTCRLFGVFELAGFGYLETAIIASITKRCRTDCSCIKSAHRTGMPVACYHPREGILTSWMFSERRGLPYQLDVPRTERATLPAGYSHNGERASLPACYSQIEERASLPAR